MILANKLNIVDIILYVKFDSYVLIYKVHREDGWYGMPAISYDRRDVGGGLRETEGRDMTNVSG